MRYQMNTSTLIAATTVLLAGCTPKLLRHYESFRAPETVPTIELSVFLASPNASNPATVLSILDGRAQAELIRSLSKMMPADSKPADLLALLQRNPETPSKSCAWASNKTATKKLVLTVLGGLRRPADRLDKLDVTFTLNEEDGSQERAKFVSWDHFDTVYGKYEIGTAKYTQSGKLSIGRTGTDVTSLPESAGSATKVLNLGAEASNSLEESATYAIRRMSIGGALDPKSARLVQEGGPNINLFGSSVATLTLSLTTSKYPIGMYSFVLLKDNKPLPPSEVTVERCEGEYPATQVPVTVNVTATVVQRAVAQGDGTISEGDDTVTSTEEELRPVKLILLNETDLQVERYALALCKPAQVLADCDRLHIQHNGVSDANVEQLLMPTRDAAVALRRWLVEQTKAPKLGDVNGLAIGMARKEAATTAPIPTLEGLSPNMARELRVIRLPNSE